MNKNNGRYGKSSKNAKKSWKNKDGRSPEEIKAQREAEMDVRKEVLIQGIKDAFGDWEAFLRASNSGNLRRFSVYNRLYLYAQNPKASYVATANSWHKIGRRVTDDEWPHPLTVLSPYEYRVEAREDDESADEDGFVKRIGFRGIREYDISQTEGPEIHRPVCMRLDGDIEDFDAVMLRLQDATSAPIYFTDEPGEDNGWYDRSNHTITIRRTDSEKAMLKTAVHEVAHSILHRDGFEPRSRDQMEVEAESTAFLVCDYFGIDTSGYSFGYVAGWAESILAERNGEKRILAIIGDLSDAAWRIIDAIDLLEKEGVGKNTKDESIGVIATVR